MQNRYAEGKSEQVLGRYLIGKDASKVSVSLVSSTWYDKYATPQDLLEYTVICWYIIINRPSWGGVMRMHKPICFVCLP